MLGKPVKHNHLTVRKGSNTRSKRRNSPKSLHTGFVLSTKCARWQTSHSLEGQEERRSSALQKALGAGTLLDRKWHQVDSLTTKLLPLSAVQAVSASVHGDAGRAGTNPGKLAFTSKCASTALGTASTIFGNKSFKIPMKMTASSPVNLPILKSRSARRSTLSSAA